jgi:hypothetical protein
LLEDFGVSVFMSTPLLFDSTCAISIARDPIKHELTKHIGIDVYYTRTHVQDGIIALHYVHSELKLQISSRMLRLAPTISFVSPNSVFLIQHEFKGGIICIIVLSLCISSRGSLHISLLINMYIFRPRTLISIQVSFITKLACLTTKVTELLNQLVWCKIIISVAWTLLLVITTHDFGGNTRKSIGIK